MSVFGGYWWRIHRIAVAGAVETLGLDSQGKLVIKALILFGALLCLWFWGSADASRDELIVRIAVALGLIFLFPFVYLWKFVAAPAYLSLEQEGHLVRLNERLTPRLRLSLPSAIARIGHGVTNQAMNGFRQTTLFNENVVLRISCKNESAIRMDGVVANLLDVRAVANDGKLVDIGFRESVPLSWSRDLKNPELTAEIPPDASRAIYVLCVFRNRGLAIYRGLDMPIEYHVMLQEPRRYRLWIQVNGKDDVSDRIAFDATADAEGRDINAVVVLADLIDPLQSR